MSKLIPGLLLVLSLGFGGGTSVLSWNLSRALRTLLAVFNGAMCILLSGDILLSEGRGLIIGIKTPSLLKITFFRIDLGSFILVFLKMFFT